MASPYIVSTPLPSVTAVQEQIAALTEELRKLTEQPVSPPYMGLGPSGGAPSIGNPFGFGSPLDWQRQNLESRIADKQKLLDTLKNPKQSADVPPAPAGAPVLAPRIQQPKVGFGDLKIPLTR